MMNVFVTTVGSIGEARFKQAQKRQSCNFDALFHSTHLHRPHSTQIERQTDELELGFCLF